MYYLPFTLASKANLCQILDMDDDEEDRDFSKGIVYDFFTQAEEKFVEMDEAL